MPALEKEAVPDMMDGQDVMIGSSRDDARSRIRGSTDGLNLDEGTEDWQR